MLVQWISCVIYLCTNIPNSYWYSLVFYAIEFFRHIFLMYNANPGLSRYLTKDSNCFSMYIVKPNKYEVNICLARDSWFRTIL